MKNILWVAFRCACVLVLLPLLFPLGGCKQPVVKPKSDAKLFMVVSEDYSCPFLYIWDGHQYQIENDIYSVARGADNEYTDYLALNNQAVPKQGQYSFEIRERSNEQSWTDVFKLVTVDHPSSVSIGVDSAGNIHSYTVPQAPVSAIYNGSDDVLKYITEKDGLLVDMYNGDTLLLDFASTNTTSNAKLVLKVRGFQGNLSEGYTAVVPSILIQTLESGSWVTRYKFFPKALWAEGVFDIRPFLSESKCVRLVGCSCNTGKYHMIDYVGLDNSADTFYSETLDPSSAVMNGSQDVLQSLGSQDGNSVFMDEDGVLDIIFPYKQLKDDVRSLVVISKGYYKPVGHTFYVSTWDGRTWVERFEYVTLDYQTDTLAEFDCSEYLPDVTGRYRVKVEHRTTPNGSLFVTQANVDYIYLRLNGLDYVPFYAKEFDQDDILSRIIQADSVYWYAVNKWAMIEFTVPAVAELRG